MSTLDDAAVERRLQRLPGWSRSGDAICRTYELDSFRDAVFFVNTVAGLAEAANHHPDVDVRYRKVTLTLSSHDVGGLTDRDFDLAEAVDRQTARYAGD